jgi:hypothetical protein
MRARFILVGVALSLALGAAFITSAGGRAGTFYNTGTLGYDVSYPQCNSRMPRGADFAVVGVTNGLPWSANPCLKTQFAWAESLSGPAAYYTNTANPGPISPYWNRPGPRTCADPKSKTDTGCSYNYGWNAAEQAYNVAVAATSAGDAQSHFWWLDVETMNSWNGSTAANTATVYGYHDYLKSRGVPGIGVYSTGYQWGVITGGAKLAGAPSWVATGASAKSASKYCKAGFTGEAVWLVQYPSKGYDANYVCAAVNGSNATATKRGR